MDKIHKPVLIKEVLEYLHPGPGKNFVDCTFGFGGHSRAILEETKPDGKILGIEIEKEILKIAKQKMPDRRLTLVNGSFVRLKQVIAENSFYPVNGILLDLGLNSWQIEQSGRGFSFRRDEPLLMNSDPQGITAEQAVNSWPREELARIFKEYGEERQALRIAQAIVEARKRQRIKTTGQLIEIIRPIFFRRGRIHFATKVFQALRIAVNNELENLEKVLPQALEVLEAEGRLVVISFHSLEDRIVKNFFRNSARQEKLRILTKKPIRTSFEEAKLNPRSRSAKLRAGTILKKK